MGSSELSGTILERKMLWYGSVSLRKSPRGKSPRSELNIDLPDHVRWMMQGEKR